MFLTSDNRRVLKDRIVQHGTKSSWMDLMLRGIRSAAGQREQSDVVEAMLSTVVIVRKGFRTTLVKSRC